MLNPTVPNQTVPNQTVPNQTAPDQTAPNQTPDKNGDPGSGETPSAAPPPSPQSDLVLRLDLDLALVAPGGLGPHDDPDPALVRPVEAGPSFDAVSVAMDIGLDALDLLLRGGSPVGPVAADGRCQVRRVGFLLDPGTLEHSSGFAWWCRQHGVRTLTHGAVLALPRAATAPQSRLLWLVPPGCGRTDPAALLACLRLALRRAGQLSRCQASTS